MRKLKQTFALLFLTTLIVSCNNSDEKDAQKLVTEYTTFVDSVKVLSTEHFLTDWNTISALEETKKMKAEEGIIVITDKPAAQEKVNNASESFENHKKEIEQSKTEIQKNKIRLSLFRNNTVGNNNDLSWINKNNILSVYQNFVSTVKQNKDSYSREDWDEIKLLYEALDSYKNTVEKEGISTNDNLKIAALKIEFAPMYTVNRIGSKTDENSEAKK